MGNMYKKIYNVIKKYDNIVIARHIGPDPDALGSSIGLKEVIKETFPNKNVYVVGNPSSKFKYMGSLDKLPDNLSNALLIVTDTPDLDRVDGINIKDYKYSIKIDHHPFVEKFCDIEYIDDSASSASQLIMELVFDTKLKMSKSAAEKLFMGLVSDTDRFLFSYTTPKTFNLAAKLIDEYKLEFPRLYRNLYMRSIREVRFRGYIENNMTVTENGLGYILLDENILKEYNVDAATAGNMINEFNNISEVKVWGLFSEDKMQNNIRGSIRSRGPIINETVSNYNGGGHKFACGVRLKDFEEAKKLISELDIVCQNYKD